MVRGTAPRAVDADQGHEAEVDAELSEAAEGGHIVRRGDVVELTEPVELNLSLGCRSRDSLLRCVIALSRLIENSGTGADIVGLRHEFGVFRVTVGIPLGNVTDVVDSRPAAVAGAQLLRALTSELVEFTPYLTPAPDDVQVHTLETFLRAAPSSERGTCAKLIAALVNGRRKPEEPIEAVPAPNFDEEFDFLDSAAARTVARSRP